MVKMPSGNWMDEDSYTQAVNEAFLKMAETTNDKDFWEVMNNWPKKEEFTTNEQESDDDEDKQDN